MSESLTLSAVDFLNLAEQRRVARIDLADVGYSGIVYVCDLSTAKQQKIAVGPKGKTRVYKDSSMEVDFSSLPKDAPLKMMMECLVTDAANGRLLESAFEDLEEGSEPYIVWPEDKLVRMYDLMRGENGRDMKHSEVEEALGRMANAVSNLIVKTVREISGTAEDAVDNEKKD